MRALIYFGNYGMVLVVSSQSVRLGFGHKLGVTNKLTYNPASIVRSNRVRIAPSLLLSEITSRTRPWFLVSA